MSKVKRFTRRHLARARRAREEEQKALRRPERLTRNQVKKARSVEEMLKGCADR